MDSKRHELVGHRPGSWQNKINTNNYQVSNLEEEKKLIAGLTCELNGLETKETNCENNAGLKAILEAQILSKTCLESVDIQQENLFWTSYKPHGG